VITSYSQVKTAEECVRKWAWSAYGGRHETRGKPQEDGDDLHAHVENYVRYGIEFDLTKPMGRLAALARDYFPTLADAPCIEQDEVVTYGAHGFRLKPDLMWIAPCGPIVVDHKTVDHYRFALTAPRLRTNLQACIYAFFAMRHYGTTTCTAQWLYYKRTEPIDLRPVETEISMDDATRVLRARSQLIDYMALVKEERRPVLDLPPTKSACLMYGEKRPCSHLIVCYPEEAQVHGSV